jgi:hypothetical protein
MIEKEGNGNKVGKRREEEERSKMRVMLCSDEV